MRRLVIMLSIMLLTLAMATGTGVANEHKHDHVVEHPHVMLLNFELIDPGETASPLDDEVVFDQCIDLANNQSLPVQAHHHSLHTGTAGFGDPSVGITRAGHVVLPLQPYEFGFPFADCAEIEALVGSA